MRLSKWIAAAALLTGCENVETSMTIIQAIAPEGTMGECMFSADAEEGFVEIVFDAANTDTLGLNLQVRNDLTGNKINLGTDMIQDNFVTPTSITPVRMDIRWECDSNGFSDELGSLFVPQFSVDDPFCLDEDTREFQGFDVINATGQAIDPNGGLGLVFIRPITVQLARAFGEVFELASLANSCCEEVLGCNAQNLQNATGPLCTALQDRFDVIAPDKLSVTKLDDIEKFRPYSVFDYAEVTPRGNSDGINQTGELEIGPSYPLRLRGVLEGVTGDGSTVSSTEYFETVHLCANCNIVTPCTNI